MVGAVLGPGAASPGEEEGTTEGAEGVGAGRRVPKISLGS